MESGSLLRLLLDLSSTVSKSATSEEAFTSILESFCTAGSWSVGQVWIPDEHDHFLECSPVWHQATPGNEAFHEASASVRFTRGMPLLGVVWVNPEVQWLDEIASDASQFHRSRSAAEVGLRTALVVPVTSDARVIAILEFFAGDNGPVDVGAHKLLMAVAAQLGAQMAKKQAESDLRRSEALFRAVADTATDAIITIDANGDIQYANAQSSRMFDHDVQALVGSPVTVIIPERLRSAHWKGFARYLETEESRIVGTTVVVPARRQDGSEFPAELSLAAWKVDEAQSFTAIVRDVSERERVLEELERALAYEREAAARLIELDHLKNTIMDTVSHDLRSPLAAIRAVAGVLKRDAHSHTLSPQQRQEHVAGLESSAGKMCRLLDDLLDLERLTSDPVPLRRRDTDLVELVRAVVLEHAEALTGRQVDLDLAPIKADVDAPKVERIVENLLLNAVRHTPPGTTVRVSLTATDRAAVVSVEDAGPGIPEDLRDKVFERFYRVSGQHGSGTGLGLSLVARLADLHGGRAWVESSVVGGALFKVELPFKGAPDD